MKRLHQAMIVVLGVLPVTLGFSPHGSTGIGLEDSDAVLIGSVQAARAGFDVAAVGDLNGDGLEDLAVGAPFGDHGYGPSAGAMHVIYGPTRGEVRLSDATTIVGVAPGDFVGEDVSGVGDIDGDGYDDLLVGAPGSIPGFQPGPARPGMAYLFYGGPERMRGTMEVTDADAVLVGQHPVDFAGFGAPPGPVGDMDGDGYDDLVIGSAAWGGETGSVYVIYGGEERLTGEVPLAGADAHLIGMPGDFAGLPVAGAGDLDGDGAADLAIGAPGDISSQVAPGSVYVVYGGTRLEGTSSLAHADVRFVGELPGDRAGRGVAGVGDVDGDGFDDLLVGANARGLADTGRPGAAYLIYGGPDRPSGTVGLASADTKFLGDQADDQAGRAVAGAGDVDGDGLDDLLIGVPLHDGPPANSGSAYLILGDDERRSGTVLLSAAGRALQGTSADDRAGSGVAIGDFNGDGLGDLLVGAEFADLGARDAGAAYVVYGRKQPTARDRAHSDARRGLVLPPRPGERGSLS